MEKLAHRVSALPSCYEIKHHQLLSFREKLSSGERKLRANIPVPYETWANNYSPTAHEAGEKSEVNNKRSKMTPGKKNKAEKERKVSILQAQ